MWVLSFSGIRLCALVSTLDAWCSLSLCSRRQRPTAAAPNCRRCRQTSRTQPRCGPQRPGASARALPQAGARARAPSLDAQIAAAAKQAEEASGPIDAQAAWSTDRKTLTLGIVNASNKPATIPLTLSGAKLKPAGTRWQIADADPLAFNDPDQPPRVTIQEQPVSNFQGELAVAPCSITLYAFEVE